MGKTKEDNPYTWRNKPTNFAYRNREKARIVLRRRLLSCYHPPSLSVVFAPADLRQLGRR
jgi:hypothetical protein